MAKLKLKKHKHVLLISLIFLFITIFAVSLWFLLSLNHSFPNPRLENHFFAVSGDETVNGPDSGFNTIDFNVELFIFVITVIIISLMSIAIITAVVIIIYLVYKRNKKIIIEYDTSKEIEASSESIVDQNSEIGKVN